MLQRIKNQWKDLVACEVKALAAEKGFAIEPDIQVLTPPKPELGDVAFPMFAFAKAMRMAPPAIAAEVKSRLEKKSGVPSGELLVAGPYLNLKIDTSALAGELYERVSAEGDEYGKHKSLSGRRISLLPGGGGSTGDQSRKAQLHAWRAEIDGEKNRCENNKNNEKTKLDKHFQSRGDTRQLGA